MKFAVSSFTLKGPQLSFLPDSFGGALMTAIFYCAAHMAAYLWMGSEAVATNIKCGDRNLLEMRIFMVSPSAAYIVPVVWYLFVDAMNEAQGVLVEERLTIPGKRKQHHAIDWRKTRMALEQSTINSLIGMVFNVIIFGKATEACGVCDDNNFGFGFYSWSQLAIFGFLKLPVAFFLVDFLFYSTHRLCHENKWLYACVHKYHHQFIDDTVACSAIACHPVEYIMVNIIPVCIPFSLISAPFTFCMIWQCFAFMHTVFSHSGYHTASHATAMPHQYHHSFQNVFSCLAV